MKKIHHSAGCGKLVLYKEDLNDSNILAAKDYQDHNKQPWSPYSIVVCPHCKEVFSLHYETENAKIDR